MVEIKKLSEIAEIINGYAFESKKYVDDGLRIIRIANVQDGVIVDNSPCFYPTNADINVEKYRLFENDILLSLTGNVGRIGMLPACMLPAVLNQRVCCLRPNESVNYKYLYYFLRRRCFAKDCIKASKGVAQLNLSTKWLAGYPIYVPDLSEQNHIVARVEELFSQLDASVNELKTAKERLKVYRQAVLKEAFAKYHSFDSLGHISERIFDGPFGSNLKTADYVDHGVRVVRLENIKNAWFDDTKQSFVTVEKYQTISNHTVYPNDLIMSTFISESIKICQLPREVGFAVNKADCIGIRLRSNVNPRFIMFFLASRKAYDTLIHQVHGATRPRVNTKQIKAMQIPVAELQEQDATVTWIEEKMSICDSIEKTVDTALQQVEALRQSILKKAFEGGIA